MLPKYTTGKDKKLQKSYKLFGESVAVQNTRFSNITGTGFYF
jgi:hypothetical protein